MSNSWWYLNYRYSNIKTFLTHPIRLPIYKNKKIATIFFSTALYLSIICQRIPKVKLANGFCHRVLKSVNSSTSKAVKNDSILSLFVTFPTMSLTSFPLMIHHSLCQQYQVGRLSVQCSGHITVITQWPYEKCRSRGLEWV